MSAVLTPATVAHAAPVSAVIRRSSTKRSAALASASLALTLAVPVSVAHAASYGGTFGALSGVLTLPDGRPAHGARVALNLRDADGTAAREPFAIGGTDASGAFRVPIEPTEELVSRARANGGALDVQVELTDLDTTPPRIVPDDSSAPPTAVFQSAIDTVMQLVGGSDYTLPSESPAPEPSVTLPPGSDYVLPTVSPQPAPTSVPTIGMDYHVPGVRIGPLPSPPPDQDQDWAETYAFVTKPVQVVLQQVDGVALGILADPDIALGYEDLSDPDVIPPNGVLLEVINLDLFEDGYVGHDGPDQGGASANGCPIQRTFRFPGQGQPQPFWKVDISVRLFVGRCAESDPDYDYYGYAWSGFARPYDNFGVWRLKFRTEAKDPARYYMADVDPKANESTGSSRSLTWTAGASYIAEGSVSGTYTFQTKKIHPWTHTDRWLYHVSWISDKKTGSRTTQEYWNGGGMVIQVPKGNNGLGTLRQVLMFRCHPDETKGSCKLSDSGGSG